MPITEQPPKVTGQAIAAEEINTLEENISYLDSQELPPSDVFREEVIAFVMAPTNNATPFGLKQIVDTTGFRLTHIAVVAASLNRTYNFSIRIEAARTDQSDVITRTEVVSEDFTLSGTNPSYAVQTLPSPVTGLKQELLYIGAGATEIATPYNSGSNNVNGVSVIIKGIRDVV